MRSLLLNMLAGLLVAAFAQGEVPSLVASASASVDTPRARAPSRDVAAAALVREAFGATEFETGVPLMLASAGDDPGNRTRATEPRGGAPSASPNSVVPGGNPRTSGEVSSSPATSAVPMPSSAGRVPMRAEGEARPAVGPLPVVGLPKATPTPIGPLPLIRESSELAPLGPVTLPGADGKSVQVPWNASLRDYFRWLEEGSGRDFGISSVTMTGVAEDDRALLDVIVRIQVNRDDGWVHVPLQMVEGVLRESKHVGAGEASFGSFSREAGHRWWLRGKGLHELTLSLIVPIRKQTPSRRLQLSVPAAAAQSLKLRVPLPELKATPPARGVMKVVGAGEGASTIELVGMGERLDLQWQPVSGMTDLGLVLQSDSMIRVALTGESVVIRARQEIQAVQGSFTSLRIRLPAGFELIDVEGKSYARHQLGPDNLVTVELTDPTTNSTILNWTLESKSPIAPAALLLEGFVLEGARRQTGEIILHVAEGLSVSRRDGEDRYVHRGDVGREAAAAGVSTSYRFLRQPFRLAVDVREIDPQFSVEPKLQMRITGDALELDGKLKFHVFRGALKQFDVIWPGRKSEGWIVEPLEAPGLVNQVKLDVATPDSPISVKLSTRRNGTFEIPIRARRPATAGEMLSFSLPSVSGAARQSTALEVVVADQIEAEVTPRGTTSARRIAAPMGGESELRDDVMAQFQVEGSELQFNARLAARQLTVQTETTLQVEADERRLMVVQRIGYDVSFDRLSQVRLRVPQSLENRVEFSLAGRKSSLRAAWVASDDPEWRNVRIELPERMKHRFQIVAEFSLQAEGDASPGEERKVRLPIVQAEDAKYSNCRIEFPVQRYESLIDDSEWRLIPSGRYAAVWLSSGPRSEVMLRLRQPTSHASQQFAIRRALVRVAYDFDGLARGRAQYAFANGATRITLEFPAGMVPETFWWDERPLTPLQVVRDPRDPSKVDLQVSSQTESGEHLLTVDYRSEEGNRFGWSQSHELPTPRFGDNVWIEQTVCEIALPETQHLSTIPLGLTPLYDWRREGVFWTRQVRGEYADLEGWLSAANLKGPTARPELGAGNAYVLTRFGPPSLFEFHTMSLSLIVLAGAGLALAAGFFLLKVPAARNFLALLLLLFTVAVASLWLTAPVQLLAQPAAFGLVLAMVAAAIDRVLKRRGEPDILTFSTSEHTAPSLGGGSSVEHRPPGALGEGDDTIVPSRQRLSSIREFALPRRDPISSSKAGSGT